MLTKGRRALGTLLCLLLLLLSSKAATGANDLSLAGYFKSYFYLFQSPAVTSPEPDFRSQQRMGLWSNRLRLHLSYEPQTWIDMDMAYDVVPRIQSASFSRSPLFFTNINPFRYRAVDLNAQLYPRGMDPMHHLSILQNLDRAAVALHTQRADITIGRQAIAWGSARVINPTDILAPFTYDTLDTEDRIGIDAVRARFALGTLSEIDVGYVLGKDFRFSNSAFYGRTKFNTHKTDIALLVMGFRKNLLTGFDLTRAIGNAGFWLETASVLVDPFGDYHTGRERNYFRASSGMDYNFTAKTYAFIEYHYNGAGTLHARDYLGNISSSAYTDGAVYLMGRHYLAPGVIYQLNPLVTLTAQALINLTDPSVFITPQLEYNIASNAYLGSGAFVGIGRNPVAAGRESRVTLRSEFGGYPNIYFGYFRYYF